MHLDCAGPIIQGMRCDPMDAVSQLMRRALRLGNGDREIRLFGEPLGRVRELYTFECDHCGRFDVRGSGLGNGSV